MHAFESKALECFCNGKILLKYKKRYKVKLPTKQLHLLKYCYKS